MSYPQSAVRDRIGFRSWAWAVIVICLMTSESLAADGHQDGTVIDSKVTQEIPERISFDYRNDSESYTVSSSHLPFKLTVSTLPSRNANTTRVAITATFPHEGFDATAVGVLATTTEGKTVGPTTLSSATMAGKGGDPATSTYEAEFRTKPDRLSRLIIQTRPRQNQVAPKNLVKSLELVTGDQVDDQYTRWGNVSDLDGDCEFEINETKLTMTVPAGCHDLAPGQPLNAPFVLNQISGDFEVQVKVVGDFMPGKLPQKRGVSYNGAGILVWDNDDHYLRVERNSYWSRGDGLLRCDTPLMEYWKDRRYLGHSLPEDKLVADFIREQTLWLKLNRKAKVMTVSLSHNGIDWDVIKSFEADFPDELLVGVTGLNTTDTPFVVTFEQFSLSADRLVAPARLTSAKAEKH